MTRKTSLTLTPADYAAATRNNGSHCLIAVALARQYGGEWSVGHGTATQVGTRRRMRLGWDARRALIRFDATSTAQARRRPVKVTLYDRGKRSRKATAAKGGAVGGAVLMAAMGDLWWVVPLAAVVAVAAAVFAALVMGKVSVPRVTHRASARPASPARWPHGPGYAPGWQARGTGDVSYSLTKRDSHG
jgi:hypothetical protein